MHVIDSRLKVDMKSVAMLIAFIVILAPFSLGQDVDAPSVGVYAGGGIQQITTTRVALQAGASYDQIFPNHWVGYMFEGGYVGAFANLGGGSALFAFNYVTSWQNYRVPRLFPFATLGYAQLFGTGNAVDFGAGVDFRPRSSFGIRVEARDYLGFTPHQHNVAIRIGFRRYFWD
jgi:hypothetical protein